MPVQIRLGDSQEDSDPKEGRRERSQFAGAASPSLHVFMDQKSCFWGFGGYQSEGGRGGCLGQILKKTGLNGHNIIAPPAIS
jgi:hypothetical protein